MTYGKLSNEVLARFSWIFPPGDPVSGSGAAGACARIALPIRAVFMVRGVQVGSEGLTLSTASTGTLRSKQIFRLLIGRKSPM
jgi:hypothetical protein